jgi:hypothetical protein
MARYLPVLFPKHPFLDAVFHLITCSMSAAFVWDWLHAITRRQLDCVEKEVLLLQTPILIHHSCIFSLLIQAPPSNPQEIELFVYPGRRQVKILGSGSAAKAWKVR